jgi:aconitate hydratase
VFSGGEAWRKLQAPKGDLFEWDGDSTYVKEPPYFEGMTLEAPGIKDIKGARVLALLGDSITTDHISPAGNISKSSPAAKYLMSRGVEPADFNSYGARRGHDEVMVRGTFANVRLKNLLVPGVEGGVTQYKGQQTSIFEASMKYIQDKTPLVVLAGKEYGTGSSRDWAAKGTNLLGVKGVIAESFERIHRSNLVGMGVIPMQFVNGESAKSLGLDGSETFDFPPLGDLKVMQKLKVKATGAKGPKEFEVLVRVDTPNELKYLKNGGILPFVLRQIVKG